MNNVYSTCGKRQEQGLYSTEFGEIDSDEDSDGSVESSEYLSLGAISFGDFDEPIMCDFPVRHAENATTIK